MTLRDYYVANKSALSVITDNAAYETKLLICDALGLAVGAFFFSMQMELSAEQLADLDALIQRRISGEPLQYILGKWSFMGHEFYVSPACLIPRQDTETLAEYAISEIRRKNYHSVLDICTGSGCIAISIAKACDARVCASDISSSAIEIAEKNAALNNADITFIKSDLFNDISGKYDIITINPPYLTIDEMDMLQKEVTFEPYNALYGGDDGLEFYRRIRASYRDFLCDGGMLLLEIGQAQGEAVCALFDDAEIIKDLCGKDRVVVVKA